MPPAIVVDGLERAFGDVLAVRGIDLAVDEGEIYAFLGPNGAGKTSTIDALTGYHPAASGSVSHASSTHAVIGPNTHVTGASR